jgi:type II secretory ATPase GspE/PulE/Tfp pilus assembly ATPase PilB-like protein
VLGSFAQLNQGYTPAPDDIPKDLNLEPGQILRRGTGCRECRNTGYRGRLGVYELLHLSEACRHLVIERASAPALAAAARKEGNIATLIEDGLTKIREGKTTIEEVLSAIAE